MALFDVVFEGGGAKGSAFVGALTALEAAGHRTRRLVGTSAGAITATLLAAGYTPREMLAAVNERKDGKPRFASFMDRPRASDFDDDLRRNSETARSLRSLHVPLIAGDALLGMLLDSHVYPTLFSVVECGGVYAGFEFVRWLAEKLAVKGIAETETLAGMNRKTGVDLSVVASDTSAVEMLVLNHRTAPGVPVVWAVRMSMSIPLVWREVVWRASWGAYRGRAKAGNTIVDGGVLSNFPIRLVAEPSPDLMGDTDPDAALNLGLLLDERIQVPGTTSPKPPLIGESRIAQRLTRLMDTMMGARDNDEVRSRQSEICRLPVGGCGTTEFDMAEAKLAALVKAGEDALAEHLKARNLATSASSG